MLAKKPKRHPENCNVSAKRTTILKVFEGLEKEGRRLHDEGRDREGEELMRQASELRAREKSVRY